MGIDQGFLVTCWGKGRKVGKRKRQQNLETLERTSKAKSKESVLQGPTPPPREVKGQGRWYSSNDLGYRPASRQSLRSLQRRVSLQTDQYSEGIEVIQEEGPIHITSNRDFDLQNGKCAMSENSEHLQNGAMTVCTACGALSRSREVLPVTETRAVDEVTHIRKMTMDGQTQVKTRTLSDDDRISMKSGTLYEQPAQLKYNVKSGTLPAGTRMDAGYGLDMNFNTLGPSQSDGVDSVDGRHVTREDWSYWRTEMSQPQPIPQQRPPDQPVHHIPQQKPPPDQQVQQQRHSFIEDFSTQPQGQIEWQEMQQHQTQPAQQKQVQGQQQQVSQQQWTVPEQRRQHGSQQHLPVWEQQQQRSQQQWPEREQQEHGSQQHLPVWGQQQQRSQQQRQVLDQQQQWKKQQQLLLQQQQQKTRQFQPQQQWQQQQYIQQQQQQYQKQYMPRKALSVQNLQGTTSIQPQSVSPRQPADVKSYTFRLDQPQTRTVLRHRSESHQDMSESLRQHLKIHEQHSGVPMTYTLKGVTPYEGATAKRSFQHLPHDDGYFTAKGDPRYVIKDNKEGRSRGGESYTFRTTVERHPAHPNHMILDPAADRSFSVLDDSLDLPLSDDLSLSMGSTGKTAHQHTGAVEDLYAKPNKGKGTIYHKVDMRTVSGQTKHTHNLAPLHIQQQQGYLDGMVYDEAQNYREEEANSIPLDTPAVRDNIEVIGQGQTTRQDQQDEGADYDDLDSLASEMALIMSQHIAESPKSPQTATSLGRAGFGALKNNTGNMRRRSVVVLIKNNSRCSLREVEFWPQEATELCMKIGRVIGPHSRGILKLAQETPKDNIACIVVYEVIGKDKNGNNDTWYLYTDFSWGVNTYEPVYNIGFVTSYECELQPKKSTTFNPQRKVKVGGSRIRFNFSVRRGLAHTDVEVEIKEK